ncbi:hypothetical protein E4U15_001562 [Claviceps sp. LM218 group G6]|nr:hypothetical protein E4U15_001562 [Claviceps sp. LM218 group G6]
MTTTKFAHMLLEHQNSENHEFKSQIGEVSANPSPKRAKSGAADPVQTDTETAENAEWRWAAGHERRETLLDV